MSKTETETAGSVPSVDRQTSAHLGRFESLDALRGIAIIWVMLLHFAAHGKAYGDDLLFPWVWRIASHGYLGVQLFFVISGYCIARAAYFEISRGGLATRFLNRRLRRILPPYWISILLALLLGLATSVLTKVSFYKVFPLSPADWIANIFLMQGPTGAESANLVYWSLSIEMQFYFIMTLMVLCKSRIEVALLVVTLVSLFFTVLCGNYHNGSIFTYWPGFACGIVAFQVSSGIAVWRLGPLAITLLLACGSVAGMLQQHGHTQEGHISFPEKNMTCILFAAGLLLVLRFDKVLMKLGFIRSLASIGLISYSLYLTHLLIGGRVLNIGGRLTGLTGIYWLPCFLAAILASTVFGLLYFRLVERRWMNV